jgi:hypothetical protein
MSNFIELTKFDGYRPDDKILVPIEKIQLITKSSRGGTSFIWIEGLGDINVLEAPETIQRLIEQKTNAVN